MEQSLAIRTTLESLPLCAASLAFVHPSERYYKDTYVTLYNRVAIARDYKIRPQETSDLLETCIKNYTTIDSALYVKKRLEALSDTRAQWEALNTLRCGEEIRAAEVKLIKQVACNMSGRLSDIIQSSSDPQKCVTMSRVLDVIIAINVLYDYAARYIDLGFTLPPNADRVMRVSAKLSARVETMAALFNMADEIVQEVPTDTQELYVAEESCLSRALSTDYLRTLVPDFREFYKSSSKGETHIT